MSIFRGIRKTFNNIILWYILAMILAIVSSIYFDEKILNIVKSGVLGNSKISLYDYIINIFGGVSVNKGGKKDYDIPFIWLSIQFIIFAVSFLKPFYYSTHKDIMKLVKTKSRKIYIIKQLIEIFVKVLLVYTSIFAGVILYAVCKGAEFNSVHPELFMALYKVNVISSVKMQMLIYPVLYSILMSLFQLCLNMYLDRMIVLVIIIAYDILAIYVPVWFMLGNMSMLYRSVCVVKPAVDFHIAAVASMILIIIIIAISIFKFTKYDIIRDGEK